MERGGSFRSLRSLDGHGETSGADIGRKRSLVRPERQRLDESHPQYHYAQAASQPDAGVLVQPSSTGNEPVPSNSNLHELAEVDEEGLLVHEPHIRAPENIEVDVPPGVDVGEEYAALEEAVRPIEPKKDGISLWRLYCRILTFPVIPAMMRPFGMTTKDRQMAWREKIGLISVILIVGAIVGFLTFGFTITVCDNKEVRIRRSDLPNNDIIVSGYVYDTGQFLHPTVEGFNTSNINYPPVNAGGRDASFMFQNVNGHCLNVITPKDNTNIPTSGNKLAWYFPCEVILSDGTLMPNSNISESPLDFYNGWGCHTQSSARDTLYTSKNRTATIYYTWDDVDKSNDHLVIYNGDVLNLNYLDHLLTDDLNYPADFDDLRSDENIRGKDITQLMSYGDQRKIVQCLREITRVGVMDTEPIGCIASSVVLYVSLVFIIGLVAVKFLLACYFRFFMARKQGAFPVSNSEYNKHEENIENWTDNIYTMAPIPDASAPASNPKRRSMFLEKIAPTETKKSRHKSTTMGTQNPSMNTSKVAPGGSIFNQPIFRQSMALSRPPTMYQEYSDPLQADTAYKGHGLVPEESESPAPEQASSRNSMRSYSSAPFETPEASVSPPMGPVGGVEEYWVPQPPVDWTPFGYPLAHCMCLVTAYSESVDGLRTTLDSVATTEYPNSHKLIVIICDGLIKGSGNDMSTPEICLSMMTDFAVPQDEVQPFSYVSVVSGAKRHNMAKVYAGFYKYDDETIAREKQQRVPIITIVKCGTPEEASSAKPGNRGKRDSQVILMTFLQRIMFDERMTELDFEIYNGIRSITGIAADFYEVMLMVDADTKVFPDCLTHMVAEMVRDPEIMGLCGETKIANKTESWVTAIQVFEYFISHHQAKAFESVFGGVTCLPGCFSMYRIKSPKGSDGYWVPILANPDIVERYSENVVDTLHRKNLLLLGEDRYLSTLMLRTFPRRKMIFVPKAACKTIVPEKFKILLSQRRRWINSTIHNLMELVLVRDLCGVFIISMQFVVFIDLVSTLVLPAAISFTIYIVVKAIVSKPTPTMSLILLALILGLPGVLIVVTATRPSYVLWMLVYLLALPIWNFVLPMYAYWKFDDFSWGDTRKLEGGDKAGHDEAGGEFDSSHIIMKRWREFQRERAAQQTVF